jgi:selenocysteine-specific elongation factor
MRYIILGTAGHIDHGKSSLVKALTGIDPDRLKEEKERGITIDLGFANLEYPEENLTIGIVDVPGHERLVRNMLAGAGGIDLVLLVIAADEGIMPQSREHLEICRLLKIKSGLVALTKSDLVEEDWLALVSEEVREFIKGTFLEGAEIIPVSSKTGFNLPLLKEKIKDSATRVSPKPTGGIFRLPIDRVFTLKGFGTVVTGTAVSGKTSVEDTLEILPSNIRCKVRGMHTHGRAIREAYAGQRVAVNLQGAQKDDIRRGDTLVPPGRFSPTRAIDAGLELLRDAPPLKSKSLVHFHLGTSETVARVILYDMDELKAGERCYCQMRLKEPVVAQSTDRFIIRRFSPLVTIGGGAVLNPYPSKRKKTAGMEDLKVFEGGTLKEKLAMKIKQASLPGTDKASLEGWINEEVTAIDEALNSLKKQKTISDMEGTLIHRDSIDGFGKLIIGMLGEFHRKNPLKKGMPKEEIRTGMRMETKTFGSLIASIEGVAVESDILRLKSFKAALSGEEEASKAKILSILDEKKFQPPTVEELSSMLSKDGVRIRDILRLMSSEGSAVRIIDSMYISSSVYREMINLLREFFGKKPDMAVSEFRDLLGTTRKYALPFLEYLDSSNITLRVGDVRKLLLK